MIRQFLGGHAHVNPLLEFPGLGGGPRAVAGHLPAAQGADDDASMLGDIHVVEESHWIPVIRETGAPLKAA